MSIACPYCQRPAVLLESSAEIYHGRDYGPVYICRPCEAWVGCHKRPANGCWVPLGRLANAELRERKQLAHAFFDPLWQEAANRGRSPKHIARRDAYQWLAHKLNIRYDQCHIGMLDMAGCDRVIEVCRERALRERHQAGINKTGI